MHEIGEHLIKATAPNPLGRKISVSCLCDAVTLQIDFPAFWAWHDHSAASRPAHGTAYATYIGCWRKHAHVEFLRPTRPVRARINLFLCFHEPFNEQVFRFPRASCQVNTTDLCLEIEGELGEVLKNTYRVIASLDRVAAWKP